MAFIDWTSEIAVNDEIDEQHRKLFAIVNRLHASVTAGAERSSLARIFGELIDYTIEHFKTEEACFAKLAYPDAGAHKQEHDELTRQVVRLQEQFTEGDLVISFELLDFLHGWLLTHTSDSDVKFRRFLEDPGAVEKRA